MKTRCTGLGGSRQLIAAQGHNLWEGFFQCEEPVAFVKNRE